MPEKQETEETLKLSAEPYLPWRLEVCKALHEASALTQQELSPVQIEGYLRLLAEIPSAKIAEACDRWLRESSYMPRPADILRLCGRGPDELAQVAWRELIEWVRAWGPNGAKYGEPQFEQRPDGIRIIPRSELAPVLARRTQAAVIALTGAHTLSMKRIADALEDGEKLARIQVEFVKAWKGAI